MDFDDLLALLRALHDHGVEYVLVGGVAVNLHGILRATEDVDLFVRPTEENIGRLRRALASLWNDDEIDGITASDLAGGYPTIRYGPPDTEYAIDVLSRLGTAFSFDDLEWEVVQIEGVPVRLATPATLFKMKRGTLRPIAPTRKRCVTSTDWGTDVPLRKFKDAEEARRALWTGPGDPELPARIRQLWARARRLAPGGGPRGVRRFRTIEEADAERNAWIRQRVRAIRDGRRKATQ